MVHTMKDEQNFNVFFVKTVEKYPLLYDNTIDDYYNPGQQEEAWEQIAQIVNETVPNCKEKWKNIRGCWCRHLRQRKTPTSVLSREKKNYYLSNFLSFLTPFIKLRGPSERMPRFGLRISSKYVEESNSNPMLDDEDDNGTFNDTINDNDEIDNFNSANDTCDDSDENDDKPLQTLIDDKIKSDESKIVLTKRKSTTGDISTVWTAKKKKKDKETTSSSSWSSIKRKAAPVSVQETSSESWNNDAQPTTEPKLALVKKYSVLEEEDSDLNFLKSLLPDIVQMTPKQKHQFKLKTLQTIDSILYDNPSECSK